MIGIGLDCGSGMAGQRFQPIQVEINRKLGDAWPDEFTEFIKECVMAFRISGAISDFGFSGIETVKIRKRPSRVTVDIGITEAQWQNRPEGKLRDLMADLATKGLESVVAHLQARGLALPKKERLEAAYRIFEDARASTE